MIEPLEQFGVLLNELNKKRTKASRETALRTAMSGEAREPLIRLWQATLHPYITYGITTVPSNLLQDGLYQDPYTKDYAGCLRLLDDLASRNVTGSRARWAVWNFAKHLSTMQRRAFRAIIERKPRCGVSRKNLNKVFPGTVPMFQIAKAEDWDHAGDHANALCNRGAIVEKKENGERRVYIRDTNMFLTSSGAADETWPSLVEYLRQIIPAGVVVDGELVHASGSIQKLANYTRTQGTTFDAAAENITYVIFDVMPTAHWVDQKSDISQHIRSRWIQEADFGPGPVKAIPQWLVTSAEQMDKIFLDLIADDWEGVIIKDPAAPYSFKRAQCWVKRKMEKSADLTVLSVLPGEPGGKFAFTLGRFVCQHNGVEVRPSPGRMTDDLRDAIWKTPNDYIGKVIEVVYQTETPDGSLQHPRFKRFRGDKV